MRHSILVAATLVFLASTARAESEPHKDPTTATMTSIGGTVLPILAGVIANADSVRGLEQPLARTTRSHAIAATAAPSNEVAAPARVIDPSVARAVLAPRLIDRGSVVEQTPTWIELAKPREKKPWRPRILPLPMSSPTGGYGVKVKIRF